MIEQLDKLFDLHDKDLDYINNQRRKWLYASSAVFAGIIFIIFGWDWLDHFHSDSIWWLIISLMLLLSINWWYWTMRVVSRLLHHQKIEFHIIKDLIVDIRELKADIKELGNQRLDKSK